MCDVSQEVGPEHGGSAGRGAGVLGGSAASSRCRYHVFLSFRGDTRKAFTDHLYTALDQAGYHTFRDNNEIERGESINSELEKAIQQSRISIIVFSKDYASSKSCLYELVIILRCRRTSGHVVLPIFYDVDPTVVRNQTDSFSEAFAGYEEQLKAETNYGRKMELAKKVRVWREALKEVADLAGMSLQNEANGQESKFIKQIVKVIGDKLSRTIMSVAMYPVGIRSRAKAINLWLQDASMDVSAHAIWGMGGLGKTTVAKYVYNLNFHRFAGSSFLANIREVSKQPRGLIQLQSQLLSDILKRKKDRITTVDEGIVKIEDAICAKRVLLVLDDVDDVEQLNAILGMRDWFYPGSKIIITTRHEWLLKPHAVYKIHEIEKLDDEESIKLFSWHAFGQEHPTEQYMEHSKRVVHHCGGLPLALQVLASFLSRKTLDIWDSALAKLQAIPNSQIIEKLKISYDSLEDDHDKNLFLHIACFFCGEDKYFIVKVLDACGFYSYIGIQNLIDRCLLTINDEDKIMMHQLIQDMGREIVRQESPKEPGKRSRLWRHQQSYSVLKEMTGTKTIEGLLLDMQVVMTTSTVRGQDTAKDLPPWQSAKAKVNVDAFVRMDKLRLLTLNYVQLAGSYKNFPKKLRWLCWHGFNLKSIPKELPLGNLVALDMSYSKLERVWEGTKSLGALKVLNLSYSQKLMETPDFSGVCNLERLVLKGCQGLLGVGETIGFLKRLVLLNLEDCRNLRKLPKNISMLQLLETLIISGCSNLDEFPTGLTEMESLKVLHADGCAMKSSSTINRQVYQRRVPKPRKGPITPCIADPGFKQ
ncbi:hypothetical protein RJ640_000774 [Escallonia rubra]|uniref:TIR domain-containing protein n=1 Tax=Escallonia rubra TaxID=112253 RepID=A0AA88UUG3_9ASTE|nr:hypothetical protein RJ640_000774 [Escallonia rubra]